MTRPREDEPGPMSTLGGEGITPPEESRLGYGAGGVVLRGEDRHLPREVAWKVARGSRAKALLAHEAQVLAALEHPSIVAIHDLVEGDDDSLRIALRLVRGKTLHEAIRSAPDQAARLRLVRPFLQAVEAVAWAHRVGWVHRDLKPANIMVGEFGETQVIDWGLAESLDDPTSPAGSVVGTPATMCPEQARGEGAAPTFDVWGLGATLFELVHGRGLFEGIGPKDVVARLRLGELPDITDLQAPPELRAIITRCLEVLPANRYPDARALAVDLSAWLEGRRVEAHRYSALELSRRFVHAWRLPLGVLFAAIVTAIIAAVIAFDRIGDERDGALIAKARAEAAVQERDLEIATSGLSESRRALSQFLRPEAERAAARTLAVQENAEARGIMLAFSAMPRPERQQSRPLPGECVDVRVASDGRVLCLGQDKVQLLGAGTDPGWTHRLPLREATFVGDHIVVAPPDGAHRVLDRQGRLVDAHASTECTGRLTTDPMSQIGLDLGHACAEILSYGSATPLYPTAGLHQGERAQSTSNLRTRLDPCGGRHIEVGAIFVNQGSARFAGLCIEGDLVVVEANGATRRTPSILPDADTLLAAVFIDADRLLVGGSRGELTVLSLGSGVVTQRGLVPNRGGVRTLMPLPEVDRLAIEGLSGEIAIATLETLLPLSNLPLSQTRVAGMAASPSGQILWTAGSRLESWSFPKGPPARFVDLGGVTHASVDPHHLTLTHDRSARVIDLDTGRVEVAATWDGVIAKQAVRVNRQLAVGLASETLGAHLVDKRGDDLELVELPAIRRVASLSGGRLIGGRTGPGLVFWRDLRTPWERLSERQVTDLATLEDQAAVLFTSPREAVLYEAAGDPMPLSACATPGATAIALISGVGDPTLLVATSAGLWALRPDGEVVSPARECSLLMSYMVGNAAFVRAAATEDGRFIAGGTRAGVVHVWRPDGVLVASLGAHTSAVTTLGATGSMLVSGAWDGRVQLMDLDVLDLDRRILVDTVGRVWGTP